MSKSYLKKIIGFLLVINTLKSIFCYDLSKVAKSFNRENIELKYPPFCIIRHREEGLRWVDYYLSYDRANQLMYIQKNHEEAIEITNFQTQENFVLCYLSQLVENQITLVSLQRNYTYFNTAAINQFGQYIGTRAAFDAPQAIITEYRYNITSKRMVNAGFPIRPSNDTDIKARYSIQIEILDKGVASDLRQYGLGPIPNYDYPFNVYKQPNGAYYAPNLFFYQFSYLYSKFYTQQFNALPRKGGFSTILPQYDDVYSILHTSTVQVTDKEFKQIFPLKMAQDGYAAPLFELNQEKCRPEIGCEYQPINDQFLMLKRNNSYSIIEKKDFWIYHYNFVREDEGHQGQLECRYSKNDTHNDLYYYDLGDFEISPKDWLGIIEIEENDQKDYLLTQAVFTTNETLQAYRFYQIDLQKKSKPKQLTQDLDFDPIQGYYFYEGFTYYRGDTLRSTFNDLNRYSMIYLVNHTSVLKLQFNMKIMLNEGNLFSWKSISIIANTLLVSMSIGIFLLGCDKKKKRRQIKEAINKLKISYIIGLNNEDENIFKNFYLPSIKHISIISKKRQSIFEFPSIVQEDQIYLPSGALQKMEVKGNSIYSILLPQEQIDNMWSFIKSITHNKTDGKYNESHYIFSEIKNLIQNKSQFYQRSINRFLFVVEESSSTAFKIYLFNNQKRLSHMGTQISHEEAKKENKQFISDFAYRIEDIDFEATDQIQLELILIRKFTIALNILKQFNLLLPPDFLDYLQFDIFNSTDNDVTINPLLIFFAFQQNLYSSDPIEQSNNYLESTRKFIKFLEIQIEKQIPFLKFTTFDDCLRYYDFHISMRELQARFQKKEVIGFGGYGKVYNVKDLKTDEELAVKAQNILGTKQLKAVTKEFNIMKHLTFQKKQNVINFCYGLMVNNILMENSVGQQKEYNLCLFVMEKGETSLQKEMEIRQIPFSKEELQNMIYSLCHGLYELHVIEKLIHMDVSLDNILKTREQTYKLSDLGGGIVQKGQYSYVSKGMQLKHSYISPELKKQLTKVDNEQQFFELKKNYDLLMQNDCYALGLVLYMVITFDISPSRQNLTQFEESEKRRTNMISNLEKYKSSNSNRKSEEEICYPDYLICLVQDLLNYCELKHILEIMESNIINQNSQYQESTN